MATLIGRSAEGEPQRRCCQDNCADYVFHAALLPLGEHAVGTEFAPWTWRVGLAGLWATRLGLGRNAPHLVLPCTHLWPFLAFLDACRAFGQGCHYVSGQSAILSWRRRPTVGRHYPDPPRTGSGRLAQLLAAGRTLSRAAVDITAIVVTIVWGPGTLTRQRKSADVDKEIVSA